jgi:hypothetical protein
VDTVPRGGGYPTLWWLLGEVVTDNVVLELPGDAPAEAYKLIVGWYDPETGARLPVVGQDVDFAELTTVTLE